MTEATATELATNVMANYVKLAVDGTLGDGVVVAHTATETVDYAKRAIEGMLGWYLKTFKVPYGVNPTERDAPMIVAARLMARGAWWDAGEPGEAACLQADALVDAEYATVAATDRGQSYNPGLFTVRYVARLLESLEGAQAAETAAAPQPETQAGEGDARRPNRLYAEFGYAMASVFGLGSEQMASAIAALHTARLFDGT